MILLQVMPPEALSLFDNPVVCLLMGIAIGAVLSARLPCEPQPCKRLPDRAGSPPRGALPPHPPPSMKRAEDQP